MIARTRPAKVPPAPIQSAHAKPQHMPLAFGFNAAEIASSQLFANPAAAGAQASPAHSLGESEGMGLSGREGSDGSLSERELAGAPAAEMRDSKARHRAPSTVASHSRRRSCEARRRGPIRTAAATHAHAQRHASPPQTKEPVRVDRLCPHDGGGGGNRTRVRKSFHNESYKRIRPIESRAPCSDRRDLGTPARLDLVRRGRAATLDQPVFFWRPLRPPQAGSGKASQPN